MAGHATIGRTGVADPPAKRSLMLRVAVTGSAIAGGIALVVVTGPLRPEIFISAGIAVFVAAAVYLAQPRAGTIAFLALGTAICAACAVALFTVGAVPWLLTSFWAGAATLLAGLLDLIGRDGTDPMIGVTVAAVVSLLLLSALGLGQYVRVNWPLTSRAMLESLPQDVTEQTGARTGATRMVVEQAPGGRWVGHWIVRTRDTVRTWDSFALAVRADGWSVRVNKTCEELRAVKDGYVLRVVAEETDGQGVPTGPSKYRGAPQDTLEMAAYVSVPER